MDHLQEYEEAIRTRVCTACLERTGRGTCGMGRVEDCTLNAYLPEVIALVNSIESDSIYDYFVSFRSHLCPVCRECIGGSCTVRELLGCPLDRYLPLIVESVKQVNRKQLHRT